jgi:rsbT co-antagonist protein RsbR
MSTASSRPQGATEAAGLVGDLLVRRGGEVLTRWLEQGATHSGAPLPHDARSDGEEILAALQRALTGADPADVGPVRRLLGDLTARRTRAGARPAETAAFVFALREALLAAMESEGAPLADFATARWVAHLVDELAIGTFDSFLEGREEVISMQGQQLLDLSTPVVRVWDRVVAAPLVGTLDSARAQAAMESLLQAIADDGALIAILDITGVPTVDTLVAQHLLKTVAATRLMGADCIVSGIRPQTAQTIVQLGINLADVTTRSTLADALATAIDRVQAHAGRA